MKKADFIQYLTDNSECYRYLETNYKGYSGLLVDDLALRTETFFTDGAIEARDLNQLLICTHQGKHIEQITRVTGYFSKIKNWNAGKKAELRDRARVRL